MPYNKRVQTNNASTSELNGRTGIQLKNYMKASSSSSVDAALLSVAEENGGKENGGKEDGGKENGGKNIAEKYFFHV